MVAFALRADGVSVPFTSGSSLQLEPAREYTPDDAAGFSSLYIGILAATTRQ